MSRRVSAIVLCTLNARYIHASLGLRYLKANLGALEGDCVLLERDASVATIDVAETILAHRPRIVGLGVYVWNLEASARLAATLKELDPALFIVVGGPEVSHELEAHPWLSRVDCVITGEADVEFRKVCEAVIESKPVPSVINAQPPTLTDLKSPYSLYTAEDIAHRLIYVEASRGCVYRCQFCLSSLDKTVRSFELEQFLAELENLLGRGVTTFKFVDRTFNLEVAKSRRILELFLERLRPGLFLHFEMVPDRFPEELKALVARFPAGVLQFEVGVQTLNPEVEARIERRQSHARLADNFAFLVEQTKVHVHADLIAGLPGESLASFKEGFDALFALKPHEIQVGVLKRLKGTPITRHQVSFGLVFSPFAPFEVLRTSTLSVAELQGVRRFAWCFDTFSNSGRFGSSLPLLMGGAGSAFERWWSFSQWLAQKTNARHGVSLLKQFEHLFSYLTDALSLPRSEAAMALWSDYQRQGKTDLPGWLKANLPEGAEVVARPVRVKPMHGERQARRG